LSAYAVAAATLPSPPPLRGALPISALGSGLRAAGVRLIARTPAPRPRRRTPQRPLRRQLHPRRLRRRTRPSPFFDDGQQNLALRDRKSTRLNSSHVKSSYDVLRSTK